MKPLRFNLKTKLLLFSASILFIPWIGYQYVNSMEAFLKTSVEDTISTRAHSIAIVLQQQTEILQPQSNIINVNNENEHLYLRTLDKPVQLDGYTDDWHFNKDLFQEYSEQHVLKKSNKHRPGSLHFSQATGSYKQHLFAVFKVSDDHIIYHNPTNPLINRCDHLRIALQTPEGEFRRYYMSTVAPGRLSAHRMPINPEDDQAIEKETRIQGAWQETADGYTLEIRLPLSMIGSKLSFAINDVDDPDNDASIIGSSNTEQLSTLSTIMVPSSQLEKLLQTLGMESSRIWVIDKNKRVLALSGNLNAVQHIDNNGRSFPSMALSALYRLILQQPATAFEDELSGASKLNGREIESALRGQSVISWRDTTDRHASILTATYPIKKDQTVVGAVMLEQNSARILLLQNQAMEELINLSIPVLMGGMLFVVFFASRLTTRIGDLRDQTERAINSDGKVVSTFQSSSSQDEIGDLSRTFSGLLTRLHQYNRYLETMASKLSHELRTPLSVVRSSLDNLEQTKPETVNDTYMNRAKHGLNRLNDIINRLSEASRLEQAFQQAEKEALDLNQLIYGCIEGYKSAYPQQTFNFSYSDEKLLCRAAPDLLVQMMDKLISNAVDFALENTPISISLSGESGQKLKLSIANQGPHLPEDMQESLFDSMVSLREDKVLSSHLGLGLYIVKLIVDYHEGHIEANNLYQPNGVEFTLTFNTL